MCEIILISYAVKVFFLAEEYFENIKATAAALAHVPLFCEAPFRSVYDH